MRRLLLALVAATALHGCLSTGAPTEVEGGNGGGGAGGAPACADFSAAGECHQSSPNGDCPLGELCGYADARCAEGACCVLPATCLPDRADRLPGGVRCAEDADCASGLCVPLADGGVCAQPCRSGTCRGGRECVELPVGGGARVPTCVALVDGEPSALAGACLHDGHCAPGRRCRIVDAALISDGLEAGRCDETASDARVGESCEPERRFDATDSFRPEDSSAACPGRSICLDRCQGEEPGCRCHATGEASWPCLEHVCTKPCATDAECPSGTLCDEWNHAGDTAADDAPPLRFCLRPRDRFGTAWGCTDERDCCAGGLRPDGGPCCYVDDGTCGSTPIERTHCRLSPSEDSPERWLTTCQPPSGLGDLSTACADHGACESGLCVDGRCASPCAPGPNDRCDAIEAGTQCCPVAVDATCAFACRTSCTPVEGCG